MKAVILAGGLGTRLSEETTLKPKPMVEIGEKPIIWHIMKIYASYGINDFIICLGYKGYQIKEYFLNYYRHQSDITIDLSRNVEKIHCSASENWRVTLVDTGENTMTGGRIKRIKKYIKDDEFFCLTYGDGVADINIAKLINFHRSHGKLATLTATYPPGRFGALSVDVAGNVLTFQEKVQLESHIINGGFFVLSPAVLNYIDGDGTSWENEPLTNLASQAELMAYTHAGFWQPMDTLRDKNYLNELWKANKAPWKIW